MRKQIPQFTYTGEPQDMEGLKKIWRGIFGRPGKINGVSMKEKHCLMKKYESGSVRHIGFKKEKDIVKYLEENEKYQSFDLYIGRDTYTNRATHFNSGTHFSCKTICIDIDNHFEDPESVCGTVNTFLEDLVENKKEYKIPMPNAAVYTGRGVQLWYFLKSASAEIQPIVGKTAEALCKRITSLLEDSPLTYADFEVDTAASARECGLSRLPGSYNHAAKCFSQGYCFSTRKWDINDLKKKAGVPDPSARKEKREGRKTGGQDRSRFAALLYRTMMEAAKEEDYMSREILCHIYHSVMTTNGIDEETAEENVRELNQAFGDPLPEKQIRYLVRCNLRHGYRYSEKKIFEAAGISPERMERFYKEKRKLYKARDYREEHAARDQARREARVAWHNQIRMLAQEGHSDKEICEITGRCLTTVRKYMGTPMEDARQPAAREPARTCAKAVTKNTAKPAPMDEDSLKRRAVQLYKQGFRPSSIAKIMQTTADQVDEYLFEYREYRRKRREIRTASYYLGKIGKRIRSYKEEGEKRLEKRADIAKSRLLDLLADLGELNTQKSILARQLNLLSPRSKNNEELQKLQDDIGRLKTDLWHWQDQFVYEKFLGGTV